MEAYEQKNQVNRQVPNVCQVADLSVTRVHTIWNAFAVINLSLLTATAIGISKGMVLANEELTYTMERGLRLYVVDKGWTERMNNIHQGLGCCGVADFEDWLDTKWIPVAALRMSFTDKGRSKLHPDGRPTDLVVPGSCCNPSSEGPCLHDSLQQLRTSVTMENVIKSIFTEGCLPALVQQLTRMMNPFKAIHVLMCIFQALQILFENIIFGLRKSKR